MDNVPSLNRFVFLVAVPLSVMAITGGIGIYVKIQAIEIKYVELAEHLSAEISEVKIEAKAIMDKVAELRDRLVVGTSDRYRREDAKIDAKRFWTSIHKIEENIFNLAARECAPVVEAHAARPR